MNSDTAQIQDPLPRRYLSQDPGIGGVIKVRPEDFCVEELPLYEPCGDGEHLYLGVEKAAVSHAEMFSALRRHFGVDRDAIGFAGMKDKLAVTQQTVSIHLPGREAPTEPVPHERIRVLWDARHTNKIRIGHLAGNRFSIRIRECDPMQVPVVKQRLMWLERHGIPNYFGQQRFGYRRNNHRMGLAILKGDWDGLLSELLGTTGSPYPEYQRQRRELYDQGRYQEAAVHWTPADRNELVAIKALLAGRKPRLACRDVGKGTVSFWISSLQSAVFNRVLDQRLEEGMLETLVEGDLAYKHDSGAVFAVTAEELARPELAGRVTALDLSPSGPLWGAGMTRAAGRIDRVESEALEAINVDLESFEEHARRMNGARRSLRVAIRDPQIESGVDEHGPFIRTAFELPPGAYATVVLRELMKVVESNSGDPVIA